MKKLYYIGLVFAALATPAFAGKGALPSGKPFIQINDQIVEVKSSIATLESQIEALFGKVTNLEDNVKAHELAIMLLRQQDTFLAGLIDANKNSIDGVLSEIDALKSRQVQLETAIATNGGDIEDLKIELTNVKTKIVVLEEGLASVSTESTSLKQKIADLEASNQSLQSQIDANGDSLGDLADAISSNNLEILRLSNELLRLAPLEDIVALNTERLDDYAIKLAALEESIKIKQNILSGTCPEGETLVGFEEGSLLCKVVDSFPEIKCPEGQALAGINEDGSGECLDVSITIDSLKLGCPNRFTLNSIDLENGTGVCTLNSTYTKTFTTIFRRSILLGANSSAYSTHTAYGNCYNNEIQSPIKVSGYLSHVNVLRLDHYKSGPTSISMIQVRNNLSHQYSVTVSYSCSGVENYHSTNNGFATPQN